MTVLVLQPLLSQWVTVTVVYDFGEVVVAEVSSGHSEVTVLVLQPLLSQWVTVTVVYDLEETVSVATVPVDVVT